MEGIREHDFERIFNTWYETIRNFLYYKTGDIAIAEDIAQDVFLKVWEKRAEIRQETIRPYLYKLANNMFLNHVEHRNVQLKFNMAYQPVLTLQGPDYDMEVREFDNRLKTAINKLDDKKRSVFLMNRIEKLTYGQIAESIGITVKAVEKRMEKALAFLKEQIEINI
jgi:RNA polymerase sigma-70 factor (family 1)